MTRYEYTVIPAPVRGEKSRAAKTAGDRFALALTQTLNQMGAQGWEYVRAETLPSEERSGLTSRTTVWNNVLVFRRSLATAQADATSTAEGDQPRPPAPAEAPPSGPFSQRMRPVEQDGGDDSAADSTHALKGGDTAHP